MKRHTSKPSYRSSPTPKMTRTVTKHIDQISSLPESLLHLIMSPLPAKEIARMSILSKRFKSVWDSYPVLDLDNTYSAQWTSKRGNPKFMKFINDALQRNHALNLPLEKLRLHFRQYSKVRNTSSFAAAIDYAMTKQVQELNLLFISGSFPITSFYKLPERFFLGGKSIRVLKLVGLKLNGFNAANFPSIEELSITGCGALESIKLSSKLIKILAIDRCLRLSSISIADSPNLKSFSYQGFGVQNSAPCQMDISSCNSMETLELQGTDSVTDEWVEKNVSKLTLLKELVFTGCEKLGNIRVLSLENLRIFKLMGCRELKFVEVHAPRLISFVYNGGIAQPHLIIDSPKVDAKLHLIKDIEDANGWFQRLREFLGCFDHCKSVTLASAFDESLIFSYDGKDGLLPPLSDIKNLKVELSEPVKNYVLLVDSLLWLAPLVETISIVARDHSSSPSYKKSLKFEYAKPMAMGEKDNFCCYGHLVKCWRHYLKNVFMENFTMLDKQNLIRYFSDEALRLDGIIGTSR